MIKDFSRRMLDATGGAGGGDGGAAAAAAAAAQAAAAGAAKPWHDGVDVGLMGVAQAKGWKLDDPKTAFAAAASAYDAAQKLIGVPQEKLLRLPETNAEPAVLDAFWQRLGAPKEGKEIDFSAIKGAGDKPFDEKLAEALRSTAVTTRAPKEVVLSIAKTVQKHMDDIAAAEATIRAGNVQTEREALDRSWGANKAANLFIVDQTLQKLAVAANLPIDKAKAAFDFISKLDTIGAAPAMEMLLTVGRRMGEDKFVAGGGAGGNGLPMTREAAAAEITQLKGDPVFSKRYLEGGVEERKRMDALHKIAHARAA